MRSDRGTQVCSPVGLQRSACFCSAYIKAPICVLAGGSMGRSGEVRWRRDDVRGGGLATILFFFPPFLPHNLRPLNCPLHRVTEEADACRAPEPDTQGWAGCLLSLICSCQNANEAHMWISNVRCGPLLRLMFDTLLSAPLISSNNSHLCKLPPLFCEMIHEASNFKMTRPWSELQVARHSSFSPVLSLTLPWSWCIPPPTSFSWSLSSPISSPLLSCFVTVCAAALFLPSFPALPLASVLLTSTHDFILPSLSSLFTSSHKVGNYEQHRRARGPLWKERKGGIVFSYY